MTNTKVTIGVLIMVLTFIFLMFSKVFLDESNFESASEQWVVIEDTDSVKPYKGIAERIVKRERCRVIDWLDDDRVLAYKYSDTVFGDDRGIVSLDARTGEVLRTYSSVGTFENGSVSPDKSLCVYSVASTESRDVVINILNLKTGETIQYQANDIAALTGLNTYNFEQIVNWYDNQSAILALSTRGAQITFGELIGTKLYIHEFSIAQLTIDKPFHSTRSFVRSGERVIGSVDVDDSTFLVKYDLLTDRIQNISLDHRTEVISVKDEDHIIVRQQTAENTESIRQINESGKIIKTLTKFEGLEYIKAYGDVLIYILKKDRAEIIIGRYDMETGSDNIIATYTDVWIHEFYLSPDGRQLALNFDYGSSKELGRRVSHLIMMK